MPRVSIIIPAYNEEERIGRILEEYCKFFRKEKEIIDIIVVLNACEDDTLKIVKGFQKKFKEIRFLDFEQGGKGFAVVKGFEDALKNGGELIGFADADMATPPEAFYDLIKNIKDYDGIIADRWHKDSKIIPKQSLFRRFISRIYNLVVRTLFLFPYKDTQCGAKLFKREIIKENYKKLVTSNWGFDVALLYCLRRESHARIKSIPTTWNDQEGSKINLKKTPLRMLVSCIRLRLIHSPFKDFVRLYRRLPEKLKFH